MLVHPDAISLIEKGEIEDLGQRDSLGSVAVLTKQILRNLDSDADLSELERCEVLLEKGAISDMPPLETDEKKTTPTPSISDVSIGDVNVLSSPVQLNFKNTPEDFVRHFKTRFTELSEMLRVRQELQSCISISRLRFKPKSDSVSLLGMVSDMSVTKKGNLLFSVEDPTGTISVLVNKNNTELFAQAKEICLDDVMGAGGTLGNNIVFANTIVLPEIPLHTGFKKAPTEEYAVFLGDLHVGSDAFLENEFNRFILWINGALGNKRQSDIASKVRYLVVAGDLVEGVGVYPAQEQDLLIKDIYAQYARFAQYMAKIPPQIKIILCAGNHDAVRLSEPQPPVPRDLAPELYSLPNLIFVENPSSFSIGKTENFPGFNVLLYHGGSFIYYADTVESIRLAGGLTRVDLISQYLLRRRHLAPSQGSTLYSPNYSKDPLVISHLPDFFVSGHIHRATAKTYRNISILNCSCWIGQTKYQEKVGLKPQPARVPIVNLQTREIKMLSFLKE